MEVVPFTTPIPASNPSFISSPIVTTALNSRTLNYSIATTSTLSGRSTTAVSSSLPLSSCSVTAPPKSSLYTLLTLSIIASTLVAVTSAQDPQNLNPIAPGITSTQHFRDMLSNFGSTMFRTLIISFFYYVFKYPSDPMNLPSPRDLMSLTYQLFMENVNTSQNYLMDAIDEMLTLKPSRVASVMIKA